jgi:holin-like protein
VIGMLMLFGWLVFDHRLLPVIQNSSNELLRHLSLLFVPAGVGIMVHASRIESEWMPIVIALVISTWVAIAVTALVTRALMRKPPVERPADEGAQP